MPSVGALIWISCRPLIRLYVSNFKNDSKNLCPNHSPQPISSKQFFRVFCVTCGFIITKVNYFPTVAARGAGQIVLNITVPCLMFSKIVPAFSPDNVRALGMYVPDYFYNSIQSNLIHRSPRAYRPLV